MTKKDDLQAELLAKVKPGTKPSHLKRSKSLNDMPSPLNKGSDFVPKPPPLPLTNPSELTQLKQENNQLKTELQEVQARLKDLHDFAKSSNSSPTTSFTNPTQALSTLTEELKKQTDLNALLQEQLKEKQQQIEELEKKNSKAGEPELTELDQSLVARHKDIKDWFIQYRKTKSLEKELDENIEQASEELISQDKVISKLRTQNSQLKMERQSLQRDLKLAQRLAELRKRPPYSTPESDWNYLRLMLYSLVAVGFTLWLVKASK